MPTANSQHCDITLFVPCYNEEKNVINTFTTINETFANLKWQYEIIVVDDGSTDTTVSVIEEYINDHQEIRIQLVTAHTHMLLRVKWV